jgi:two-component system CheB/CheR fusion protein
LNNGSLKSPEDPAAAGSHSLPAAPVGSEQRANLPFPVIGVGASAGGIEALSTFFRSAPADSGMAFIVIQHLPPDSPSLMPEILSRCTSMPVFQIQDGMPVEPNTVYVIRPGFTVTLTGGMLRLGAPVEQRGHRRPVDDLFRSLALEQKEKAIIVVLSGTGTNGTAGAQAIKAAGGLCVAQDPDTAEFPGMPRSLMHSGYADQVLPVDRIPGFVVNYVRHPFIQKPDALIDRSAEQDPETERHLLNQIHALLRTRTGHDFRGYRKPTLLRRIQRRSGVVGVASLSEYTQVLREQPKESLSLANDLMINVTGFFRDPDAWKALRESVIVPLVESRSSGEEIRAWVTACSSGEEAYSLAILISEEIHRAGKGLEVKIFATDAADKSLALARAGVYAAGIEGDIEQQRLERYFEKDEHTYRVKKEIRDMVVFAPQNLLRDPPFSRVDVCTCRNFLIYLEPETQKRILSLLSFAVREGGYLFLGNTESLGVAEQSFETISKRWRIYRRVGPSQHRFADLATVPRMVSHEPLLTRENAVASTRSESTHSAGFERALLEEFVPPSVVVDRQERMLYVHGDTTPFLAYPQGELTASVVEAARPPLRTAVRTAFRQAVEAHRPVSIDTPLEAEDQSLWVRITIAPLKANSAGRNLRVTFELRPQAAQHRTTGDEGSAKEVHTPSFLLQPDAQLEDEIRILRRELQAGAEAFEASKEELKASNEEVISINEEFQSANEELETSKEELQSVNEELTTVNTQLQEKILEIEQATNDLSNLLSSTNIAVVFLDTALKVRRFTPAVQDLIELIPTDIGRSISNLSPKFSLVDGREASHGVLRDTAQVVLNKLIAVEAEFRSHSGRWYLHRALPYRTEDNHIAGVVLTFFDITARKSAEAAERLMQTRLESALEQMPAAIILVEAPTGRVMNANRRAAELFGQPYPPPFLNVEWQAAVSAFRGWHPNGTHYSTNEWPLARSLSTGDTIVGEQIEVVGPQGAKSVLSVSSAAVRDSEQSVVGAVAAFWDITQLKTTERALRDSERRLRLIIESSDDFAIMMLDTDGLVTSWSPGAERIFGWTADEMLGQSGARIFTAADRDSHAPERELQTALQNGHARDERWHVCRDGTPIWASGVLSAARDETGTLLGFVKIVRDNTEQKETEDRLLAATSEAEGAQANAEAANHAKDDFISMVSHELRTPLNTMRLWVRLLGNEALPQKDRGEGLRTLERAVLAQQQLIDDLLDISRMSSGKLRVELRPTRLTDAVGAAVESVRSLAVRKEVKLNFHAGPDIGIVRADPDRLQQVIWNLLSNAVKFTPSGGRIQVELRREEQFVLIEVSDTGIGIRPELLPYIFDRFQQGSSGMDRQHGGLGLGLAIAKQLVELHEGAISAVSAGEGHGATFVVRLPLKTETFTEGGPLAADHLERTDLQGVRILLIEDEPSSREGTARLLTTYGAEVQAVESAAAAREAYTLRSPDLIVSDIGLGGEDGYVLMRSIRELERTHDYKRVPALALTAFARKEDRKRANAAGFDSHLAKPVDPQQLVYRIGALITPSR